MGQGPSKPKPGTKFRVIGAGMYVSLLHGPDLRPHLHLTRLLGRALEPNHLLKLSLSC